MDIFSAPEFSSISESTRGLSYYIIGNKKVGKTSTALAMHEFNEQGRTLLIALEAGYKAFGSNPFTPVACSSFNQFKQIVKQLEQDAKAVIDGKKEDTEFELIVID